MGKFFDAVTVLWLRACAVNSHDIGLVRGQRSHDTLPNVEYAVFTDSRELQVCYGCCVLGAIKTRTCSYRVVIYHEIQVLHLPREYIGGLSLSLGVLPYVSRVLCGSGMRSKRPIKVLILRFVAQLSIMMTILTSLQCRYSLYLIS